MFPSSLDEWGLKQEWANHLFGIFDTPNIDLFATARIKRLPRFCRRYHHPQAWKVNASSFPWMGLRLYAFSNSNNFQTKGVPRKAINIASASERSSAVETYGARLGKFRSWAADHNCDPLKASVRQISSFLALLLEEGRAISTIRNYRLAILAIHEGFNDGSSLADKTILLHLSRGMCNERPRPGYFPRRDQWTRS